MHVRRSASGLEVLAPAKLNLFLEVLRKRDDGFHEIETLMLPIGLYDTLYFSVGPFFGGSTNEISLSCEQPGDSRSRQPNAAEAVRSEELPAGADNLAFRAVQLLRERMGVEFGARLRLIKRIPMAAGLAGGSSDAAAALVAANQGWRLNLSRDELIPIAAELGSDVPFFLGAGAAICRGRGERIEPVGGLGALHFVVVRPPAGLATAAVYRKCRPADESQAVAPLVEALRQGRLKRAGELFHNRLQPAAEALSSWIGRLREEFSRLDCAGHQMSGSGTSYFGLCRHARHAQRIAARLRNRGIGQVFAMGTC
jgi:4-diphosphocytidyl-2-C-methyl-D-erythritol kinase